LQQLIYDRDGVTDDTAAINAAISAGGRCAPGSCQGSTTTEALVYFPAGTYLISSSIIDYYLTQLIGNANCPPTLKATANFTGFGLIDGDQYQAGGALAYGGTNVFYRQIRNFVLDMTSIPASSAATGIHWPTAQATSIQNVVFLMNQQPGTQHQGIFTESGSAGFMNDLVFYGGLLGANFGNQQWTMRNLTFNNAGTGISMLFDWGWTFYGITINNCSVGLDMSGGGSSAQNVGSVTFFDSTISNCPVGIRTAHTSTSQPPTAGSLILENVQLNNVPIAVQANGATVLAGTTGSTVISGWGEGHEYTPTGPTNFQGSFAPPVRPAALLAGNRYYQRSKPQYGTYAASQFYSVRTAGATGNGVTDDTTALQNALNHAIGTGQIVFVDAGTYRVTKTITIPAGSKIVGEAYPVIMSSGSYFANMSSPVPVIQIGHPNGAGAPIEWSDMIISTQGAQAGATLIEYDLATTGSVPSGIWDVHTRIGGFAGSNLQVSQCPTTPNTVTPPAAINSNCIAAYMSLHITKGSSNLYMENNWLWTADHDIDSPAQTQVTIYTGRGLLVESTVGTIWLVGTAVEHHQLYQYQFSSTQNIFQGQIQTETPYYQPNPPATLPFPPVSSLNDPNFATSCSGVSGNCAMAWGLRILNSQNILTYGAGLYSFYNNYNTTCSNAGNGETCQARILDLETTVNNVWVYNLNTIGATSMVNENGASLASYAPNVNVFPDTIALFHT
jgi:glucan 1,3-beta-glucosidase